MLFYLIIDSVAVKVLTDFCTIFTMNISQGNKHTHTHTCTLTAKGQNKRKKGDVERLATAADRYHKRLDTSKICFSARKSSIFFWQEAVRLEKRVVSSAEVREVKFIYTVNQGISSLIISCSGQILKASLLCILVGCGSWWAPGCDVAFSWAVRSKLDLRVQLNPEMMVLPSVTQTEKGYPVCSNESSHTPTVHWGPQVWRHREECVEKKNVSHTKMIIIDQKWKYCNIGIYCVKHF